MIQTTYTVAWDATNRCYIARCAQWPQVRSIGRTPSEAVDGLEMMIGCMEA